MGYNFFLNKQIPEMFIQKLHNFRNSLGNAIETGQNIPFADSDITYLMRLQRNRIISKGVDLDYNIYSRGKDLDHFTLGSSWKDAHYESSVCFNRCGIKRIVRKDGKTAFRDDRKSVIYETVTDVMNGVHPDNDPFSCPNCGAVSTVAGLQNGCSYCGTRFRMDELFPKITSYYFLDDAGLTKKEFAKMYFICYLITVVSIYLTGCILRWDAYSPFFLMTHPTKLIGTFLAIVFGSIPAGYILLTYVLIIRFIIKTVSAAGKMGTAGSRAQFEARMKRISPEFSFEYFTSKAISLIKTAIFSDNEQELMFYEGQPLDPRMKDIIDLNYGGALGCQRVIDEGNFVTVVTKAYFDILYASENKVYYKSQAFTATFRRRTDIPVNFNFSMTRIACPSCGASFDATKIKNCPYCGNQYNMISDDWALIELKYN